jgi:hypothetical protein
MTIPLQIIKAVTKAVPTVWQYLAPDTIALIYRHPYESSIKAAGDLGAINVFYRDSIFAAIVNYFEGGSVVVARAEFKQATITAFSDTFDSGWLDGGGELPIDDDALDWIEARITEEFGHIESLFEDAKQLRRDKDFDFFQWATARADGYTRTLSAIYTQAMAMVKDNVMVTWHLGATEKHCKTCAKLDGQRHKIKWFISRNYIPRQPGADLECGGYNCDCSLSDDKGNEYTA